MNLYHLAGIQGLRPVLKHDKKEDRCSAIIPGIGKIAELPLNTVDAVLTSTGMLAYKDDANELRAVQVPGHREIYAYASTIPASAMIQPEECVTTESKFSAGTITESKVCVKVGKYPHQTSAEHKGGVVSAVPDNLVRTMSDLAMKSIYPEDYRRHAIEQHRKNVPIEDKNVSIEDRVRVLVESLTREFLKEQVSPLVDKLEKMAAINGKLAHQLGKIESRAAAGNKSDRPHPAANLTNEGTESFEITWSDQGGLPNDLASLDNPFSTRRPGRR